MRPRAAPRSAEGSLLGFEHMLLVAGPLQAVPVEEVVRIGVEVELELVPGRIPGNVVEDGAVAVSVLGHEPEEGVWRGLVRAAR